MRGWGRPRSCTASCTTRSTRCTRQPSSRTRPSATWTWTGSPCAPRSSTRQVGRGLLSGREGFAAGPLLLGSPRRGRRREGSANNATPAPSPRPRAGQERFHSLVAAYLRKRDAIVLVYDLTSPETLNALILSWLPLVLRCDRRDSSPSAASLASPTHLCLNWRTPFTGTAGRTRSSRCWATRRTTRTRTRPTRTSRRDTSR